MLYVVDAFLRTNNTTPVLSAVLFAMKIETYGVPHLQSQFALL